MDDILLLRLILVYICATNQVRMRELENQSDNFPVSVYNQQDDLAICDSVEMALRKKLEGGNYNNDELRGSCDG